MVAVELSGLDIEIDLSELKNSLFRISGELSEILDFIVSVQ